MDRQRHMSSILRQPRPRCPVMTETPRLVFLYQATAPRLLWLPSLPLSVPAANCRWEYDDASEVTDCGQRRGSAPPAELQARGQAVGFDRGEVEPPPPCHHCELPFRSAPRPKFNGTVFRRFILFQAAKPATRIQYGPRSASRLQSQLDRVCPSQAAGGTGFERKRS